MKTSGRVAVAMTWVAVLLAASGARADLDNWLVTEWGAVYHNLEKVASPKYERAEQIAGTAEHYWVSCHDGSIYRDGQRIIEGTFKDYNVVDLDARGDDWYLLTLQGKLFKNGEEIPLGGEIERPKAISVIGNDIWILAEAGKLYKNGVQVGEPYYLEGYYPEHFAVAEGGPWFDISAGTTGGMKLFHERTRFGDETWVVRELGASGPDWYVYSGKSIFKNGERIARWEPDKAEITTHVDNPVDFHFVLP